MSTEIAPSTDAATRWKRSLWSTSALAIAGSAIRLPASVELWGGLEHDGTVLHAPELRAEVALRFSQPGSRNHAVVQRLAVGTDASSGITATAPRRCWRVG